MTATAAPGPWPYSVRAEREEARRVLGDRQAGPTRQRRSASAGSSLPLVAVIAGAHST